MFGIFPSFFNFDLAPTRIGAHNPVGEMSFSVMH
jgi:hypothetical protein